MEISVYRENNRKTEDFSEKVIFNSIQKYIKKSNFPQKLLLKKIQMSTDKRKKQVKVDIETLTAAKKSNDSMIEQIDYLKNRNRHNLKELIDFLT